MPTPEPRFTAPPRSDIIERAASTIAFAFFIGAWVVAYVGVVPADPAPVRHVAVLQVQP